MSPLAVILIVCSSIVFSTCWGLANRHQVSFIKLATCQEYDVESKSCQHYFPIDIFKNNESKEYKLNLKFYVMAKNDANIVLSNSQGKGTVQYTIVVGGADNTYSWLRNTSDTTVGLDSHTPGLLSPLFPTPVIVRQKHNGQVEVSIPGITDPLLRADAADLEVQSICFYAWNTQSRWFYNCAEKEDSCSVVKRNCAQLNSRKN